MEKDIEFYVLIPMIISPMFYIIDQLIGNHFTFLGQAAEWLYLVGGIGVARAALRHKFVEAKQCSLMMSQMHKCLKRDLGKKKLTLALIDTVSVYGSSEELNIQQSPEDKI